MIWKLGRTSKTVPGKAEPAVKGSAFHDLFGQAVPAPAPPPAPEPPAPQPGAPEKRAAEPPEAGTCVTLCGVPVPPVTILMDYITSIAATAFTTRLGTQLQHDYAAGAPKSSHALYVKTAIAPVASLAASLQTGRARRNLAVLQHAHKVWHRTPCITLEDALSSPWYVAAFLARKWSLHFRPEAARVVDSHFARFAAESSLWRDPFLWLSACDLAGLVPDIRIEPGSEIGFAAGGTSGAMLHSGWYEPEPWGVWSRGHVCCLRLRAGPQAARLSLVCNPWRADLDATIAINHVPIRPVIQKAAGHDLIVLEIPPASADVPRRDLTVTIRIGNPMSPKSLGINNDTRALGIGLRAVRLAAAETAPASPAQPRADFENTVAEAGFVPIGPNAVPLAAESGCASPLLLALTEAVGGRARRILVVGLDSMYFAMRAQQALAGTGSIICVIAEPGLPIADIAGAPRTAPAGYVPVFATPEVTLTPGDPLAFTFDLVCVRDTASSTMAQALLGSAVHALAPDGLMLGQEATEAAVGMLLGLLGKVSQEREMTTTLHRASWRARCVSADFS